MTSRRILSLAALYNAAWVVLLLGWPGLILLKRPPLFELHIAAIGLVGALFAVCAAKPRRRLLGLAMAVKLGGAASFPFAVVLGYLTWSQWWLPVVNDLLWLPPLVQLWKKAGSS